MYKTGEGIVLEKEGKYRRIRQDWDQFINDDALYKKASQSFDQGEPVDASALSVVDVPMDGQELWASGVTYYRSMQGRQEESKEAGGGQFYTHVCSAPRPELFFKATLHRVVGQDGIVKIRADSTWDVPEPELTLCITSSGKIVAYTIGNDMSSRSIEGENPLLSATGKNV